MEPTPKSSRTIAVLCLIGTALLWSTGGLLIKWVQWNPIAIAGSRSFISIFVLLAFFGRPKFTFSGYQILGALAYSATVILFVSGNKLTSAANVILLQYSAPIYVALLSWVMVGERINRKDIVTIGFTLCGMALFFLDKLEPGNLLGNGCGAASGFTFAVMILCLRRQKDASPADSVILGNLLTTLISIPFMIGPVPSAQSFIGIFLLGIFQLGLAYALFTKAIKQVTALEGILIPVLEPLLNPVWVFLFMGERPGGWALIGGAVIIVSITARYAGVDIKKKGAS